MEKRKIIIGTRGSILALAQSEYVKKIIEESNPDIECEIKIIVTSGDKDLVSNWENSQASLKSFFTKEIEYELLENKIHIAVHSMKDMPANSPPGLICGAIPKREDNRDVFLSVSGKKISEIERGSKIGTSSLRRTMLVKKCRDDIEIKPIRGNIHTRIQKLKNGEYDGIVLAAAGLKRVGLENLITEYLDPEIFVPAPAQGALYIQCKEENIEIKEILLKIHDLELEKIVLIEREFSKIFDGGCHTPMGCSAKLKDGKIHIIGNYFKGKKEYKETIVEELEKGVEIAHILANKIKSKIEL